MDVCGLWNHLRTDTDLKRFLDPWTSVDLCFQNICRSGLTWVLFFDEILADTMML